MAGGKTVKVHNRSDKPDNIVLQEHKVATDCEELEKQLPKFMRGYFAYLRGNVLPMSRLSYLRDIRFFCQGSAVLPVSSYRSIAVSPSVCR